MAEFVEQKERIPAQGLVVHPGVRHIEIEQGGNDVEGADDQQIHLGHRVHPGVDDREIEGQQVIGHVGPDQRAAEHGAEDDGNHGQPFDPAIRHHQQAVGQVFGEDAVFGRGVGGGTEADHGEGEQGMDIEKHQAAAEDLDPVADEHDPPLGHGIGKGADKGRQQHVGEGEEGLQQRFIA